MQQPSIFPFGLRIDEPVTVLTDLLVTAVCFWAFAKLKQTTVHGSQSMGDGLQTTNLKTLWLSFFITMGLSTALGGLLGHGFLYAVPSEVGKWPGWLLGILAIAFFVAALLFYEKKMLRPVWFKIHLGFLFGFTLSMLIFSILKTNFIFSVLQSALGILLYGTGLSIFYKLRGREEFSKWLLFGIAAVLISGLFFLLKIGISEWFNQNDMGHIFMAYGVWFFYRAAKVSL